MIVVIILAAVFGIWLQRRSTKAQTEQIQISDVQISNFGSQFIELEYLLGNNGRQDRQINLKATVWDRDSLELASALFSVDVPASSSAKRSKLLDRLNRSLREGERPYKAKIRLYTRKIP